MMNRKLIACSVLSVGWLAMAAAACTPKAPPATATAATWRQPDVPRDLAARTADAAKYQQAWARIRGGDLRTGERDLNELLKSAAGFYPAAASLGELKLQQRDYRDAAAMFDRALATNPKYVPALVGLVDARLGDGDDQASLAALKALLAADPTRVDARARIDAVRMRASQSELAQAEKLRTSGQLDEAERHLNLAIEDIPENGPALRALAVVQLARGSFDAAEARARQAIALDPQDGASLAVLGDVLEAQNRLGDAAAAYARAIAIEPRTAWKDRRAALQDRADAEALPESYRAIPTAATVTRAQVAAVLGIRLAKVLDRAPARSSEVVTDVRGNWAASWILKVVRAGWIEAMPNHTFQPNGVVRRADLAKISAAILTQTAASRGTVPDQPKT
ncbi:MAG TPA: tetratricopeptide repeat protein, partial [Paraburkholderia sp.]